MKNISTIARNARSCGVGKILCLAVFFIIGTHSLSRAQDKDAMINQVLDNVQAAKDTQAQAPADQANPISQSGPAVLSTGDPVVGILDFEDTDILEVLQIIALKTNLNIVADDHIRGRVTIYLAQVDVWNALRTILEMNNLAYTRKDNSVFIMTDAEYLAQYGEKFNETIQTKLIPLQHAKSEDLMAALLPQKSPAGKVIFIDKTKNFLLIDEPVRVEAMANFLKSKDVVLETKTFVFQNAVVENIKDEVFALLSPDIGTLNIDATLNQLTITDTPENLQLITDKITVLDKKVEIAFVGRIVQILLNDEHQQGVDWEAIVSNYHPIDIRLPKDGATGSSGKLSLGTVSQEDFKVLFEALETVGKVQTISSPSVTVKPNQPAGIPLALTKPFQLLIPVGKPPASSLPNDFYLELSVTPAKVAASTIFLRLNSQFHWSSPADADKSNQPATISSVDMPLPESDMIVIGGLFQTKEKVLETKVPLVGSLPVVGSFFRGQRNYLEKTEFVVFLTPKIMVEEASAQAL